MITTIINNRLRMAIYIHDSLYRFRQGRGKVTDMLEAKLAQHLVGICHNPFLHIFLDVKKAYNSLDQTRCMEILRVYGLGKNLQKFLERFWEGQMVVPRSGG